MMKLLLVFLCCFLQICDGILTGYGVTTLNLGTGAEGNPVVKYMMDLFGVFGGLSLVKLLAIFVILGLHKIQTPTSVFFVISTLYFFVCISWVKILVFGFLA